MPKLYSLRKSMKDLIIRGRIVKRGSHYWIVDVELCWVHASPIVLEWFPCVESGESILSASLKGSFFDMGCLFQTIANEVGRD